MFKELSLGLYSKISHYWDSNSGWMDYHTNVDVSYQEVINYLSFVQAEFDVGDYDKIRKSINYSLSNLQSSSGAFYQNAGESYVRTSLYIISILNALESYPMLVSDVNNLTIRIKLAASWLSTQEKEWAGNHQIFTLIAFSLLYKKYGDSIYLTELYRIKSELVNDFVHIDNTNGYWPEAPNSWPNRLLTPYLQTQIIGMGYYLEITNDPELKELFIKELNFFNRHFDEYTLTFDITDSYSYINVYEPYGIDSINIGAPAVIAYSCKYTSSYCFLIQDPNKLYELYLLMVDNFERDGYSTLFTDSFYRFGAIKYTVCSK